MRSSKTFFTYWTRATVERELERGGTLGHIAGEQFGKIIPGDELWVVSISNGDLWLIGKIVAGKIVSQNQAAMILKNRDLWDANFHIIAAQGEECPSRKIRITDLIPQIRFNNTKSPVLVPKSFGPDVQQLRALRELTPLTAKLIDKTWAERA